MQVKKINININDTFIGIKIEGLPDKLAALFITADIRSI